MIKMNKFYQKSVSHSMYPSTRNQLNLEKRWMNFIYYTSVLSVFLLGGVMNSLSAQDCTVNANVDLEWCPDDQVRFFGEIAGGFDPTSVKWTQISGPAVIIDDPNDLESGITGVIPGATYTFRLRATCNDGITATQTVTYTILEATIAMVGDDLIGCAGDLNNVPLVANAPGSGETGSWSVVGSPADVTINDLNAPNSTISVGSGNGGVTTLRWTITNDDNDCDSFDDLQLTNCGGVSPVDAGPDQDLFPIAQFPLGGCYGFTTQTTLAATPAGFCQTGTWSVVSGPNIPSFADPSDNNTIVSGLIEGMYVLRWEVEGECVEGVDEVKITVPPPAGDGSDVSVSSSTQTFCDGTTTTFLTATPPEFINETGIWTKTAGPVGGPVNIVNPTAESTEVTGLTQNGIYTFCYTVQNTNTNCGSQGCISIDVSIPPVIDVDIENLVLDCGDTQATFEYTASGPGNVEYRILDGPQGGPSPWVLAGPSPATIFDLNKEGVYVIEVRKNPPVGYECGAASDFFDVVITRNVADANAGTDQLLPCGVTQTNLAGNEPPLGVGSGEWSFVSGPATPTVTNVLDRNSLITFPVDGFYTMRWTISGGPLCEPSEDDVVLVVSSLAPAFVNAGPDQNVCAATPVFLEGNTPMNTEIGTWSFTPIDTNVVIADINDPNTVVTNLADNTIYTFTWTIQSGSTGAPCGPIISDNVVITVDDTPGPDIADAGVDRCLGSGITSITMNAQTPSPGTGTWTYISGPNGPPDVMITAPGSPTTNITGLIDGTYVFEWTVTNNGCNPTSDQVTITIDDNIGQANAGADQEICSTMASLGGNEPTVGTGTWTQVSGPGGVMIANPNKYNTSLTGLIDGAYTFRWTIENGACSSEDEVSIFVTTPPETPLAGPDQTLCLLTSTTLEANTVENGYWTVVSGPSTPTFSNPLSPTSTISNLFFGDYVLQWNSASGQFCPELSDQVTITVVPQAEAGNGQAYCDGVNSANLVGNAASTGTWTFISGPTTPTITTISNNTAQATGLTATGLYTFEYTIDEPSCTSSDQTTVSIDAPPTDPVAGDDQEFCEESSFTFDADPPSMGTGMWTFQGPGTGTFSPNASDPEATFTPDAGFFGEYLFNWKITNGDCSLEDQVRITNYENPTPAAAGDDQTEVCASETTLEGNEALVGVGEWTLVTKPAAADDPVIESPILPNTVVSNLEPGTYTFRWTITNGTCDPSSDEVVVTVLDFPTPAVAGDDQSLCEESSATLDADPLTTGTGTWTQLSGPAADILNPNSANTDITGPGSTDLDPGTYLFEWTTTVDPPGTCISKDTVTIVNNIPPVMPDVSNTPTTVCFGDEDLFLIANDPSPGTGEWTKTAGDPVFILDPDNPTTQVIGFEIGKTYTFRWTITTGNCDPAFSDVTIEIFDLPTIARAGRNQRVCADEPVVILDGNDPGTGETGSWNQLSGPNTLTFNTDDIPSAQVTGYSPTVGLLDVYELQWEIANGPCPDTDVMLLRVYDEPSTTLNTVTEWCNVEDDILLSVTGEIGDGEWSKVSGPAGTIGNPSATNTLVSGTVPGEYVFRRTVSNGPVCDDFVVDVTVNNYDEISGGPEGTIICVGGTATLSANATGGSGIYTYQWQVSNSDCTNPSFIDISGATGATYTTPALSSTTSYRVIISDGGACSFVYTSPCVSVAVEEDPSISLDPADIIICEGGSHVFSVMGMGGTPGLDYQWQSSPNVGGPWTDVGTNADTYDTGPLTADTYYRVIITATGNGCDLITSSVAKATVVPDPEFNLQPADITICSGSSTTLTSTAEDKGTGEAISYQWQRATDPSGPFTDIPSATSSDYTTPDETETLYYRVIATQTPSGCSTESAVATVTVFENPLFTLQPLDPFYCLDDGPLTLSTTVMTQQPGSPTLTYQWEESTDGGMSWNSLTETALYSGTDAENLTISDPDLTFDGYQYRLLVTETGTITCSSISDAVTLSVFTCYALGNRIWHDINDNGVIDGSEVGIDGVEVQLLNASGMQVDSDPNTPGIQPFIVTTSGGGYYLFDDILLSGDYIVEVFGGPTTPLDGYFSSTMDAGDPDSDVDDSDDNGTVIPGNNVRSEVVTIGPGDIEPTGETDKDTNLPSGADQIDERSNLTVDFGFIQPMSIGNYAWYDTNDDGLQDPGEPPIIGATMTIIDAATGDPVDFGADGTAYMPTTTTDNNGNYSFDNLPPGEYYVIMDPPIDGYELPVSGGDPDNDQPNDNNAELIGGEIRSQNFTLVNGTEPDTGVDADGTNGNQTIDFALVGYSVGNRVWADENNSGDIDGSEEGIEDVTVKLFDKDGNEIEVGPDGILGTTDDAPGGVETDEDGYYRFDNLPVGEYYVEVTTGTGTPLDGLASSTVDALDPDDDSTDSDDNGVNVTPGTSVSSADFFLGPGTPEPTAESDLGPGDQGSIDERADMTVDFGFYPTLSVGDIVWYDTNNDGLQGPLSEEPPVEGATVRIFNDDGSPVEFGADGTPYTNSITTGPDGTYSFDNLPPGDYYIELTPPVPGYNPSPSGGDPDDSVINDSNGDLVGGVIRTPDFTLAPGTEPDTDGDGPNSNLTVDFGLSGYNLGNRVWADANNNGVIDPGESGINGVTVRLLDENGDPVDNPNLPGIQDYEVQTVNNTLSGEGGFYRFDNLPAGNYIVEVVADNFDPSNPLETFASSTVNGPDPDNNLATMDEDDNGADLTSAPGAVRSEPVTLGEGDGMQEPTTNDDEDGPGDAALADDRTNLTVDFGFYQRYSLGNRVFADYNNNGEFDNGTDAGISGVTVRLLDENGVPVDNPNVPGIQDYVLTTDADGYYRFDNLPEGDYIVQVDAGPGTPLDNFASSTEDAGDPDSDVDDSDDNGTVASGNNIRSAPVTLGPVITEPEPTGEADLSGTDPGTTGPLADERSNLTVDFAFHPLYRIGNLIWADANNNGLAEVGEAGIEGVEVRLYADSDGSGGPSATDTQVQTEISTGPDGKYSFENLPPGDYYVVIPTDQTDVQLNDYISSNLDNQDNVNNSQVDNNDNGVTDITASVDGPISGLASVLVTLGPDAPNESTTETLRDGLTTDDDAGTATSPDNQSDYTVDFGFYKPYRIGNLIFEDLDNDGIAENGESGIENVVVQLYKDNDGTPGISAGDELVGQEITDSDGNYSFDNLGQGNYYVLVPDDQTANPDVLNGLISSTEGEEINPNIDGDNNDNGVINMNTPVPGISTGLITLSNEDEPVDEDFRADPNDDDDDPDGGVYNDNRSNYSVDLGFTPAYRIGNLVWDDVNNNGTAENGEDGIEGVELLLYIDDDGTPGISAGDTQVASTNTDASGNYEFTGLPAGNYYVIIPDNQTNADITTALDNKVSSTDGEESLPNSNVDNNDNGVVVSTSPVAGTASNILTVGPGASEPTNELTRVGGSDDDNDGFPDNQSNYSLDFGFYDAYSLGNRVWNDANNNGLIDGGETGINGVTVRLLDENGLPVDDPNQPGVQQDYVVSTANGGYYRFEGLPEGEYIVEVVTNTGPLAGLTSSTFDGGDADAIADPEGDVDDADDNGTTPSVDGIRSGIVELGPNGAEPTADTEDGPGDGLTADDFANLTVDFGFFQSYSLGNRVWQDENNNGIIDGSESGISGIDVRLLDGSGNPIDLDPFTPGIQEAIVTTDVNGYYRFDDLVAGDYIVEIAASNFAPSGELEFFQSSTVDASDPDDDADDVDDNGSDLTSNPGAVRSLPVTLGEGNGMEEPTGEDSGPGDPGPNSVDETSNLTVDFGFFPIFQSIGSTVFLDLNNNGMFDGSESGIPGVAVQLVDVNTNTVIETVVTDGSGNYLFDELGPGTYRVQIPDSNFGPGEALENVPFSSPGQSGLDDQTDNNDDGIQTGGEGTIVISPNIVLTPGDEPTDGTGAGFESGQGSNLDNTPAVNDAFGDMTVDFGFFGTVAVGDFVWVDLDGDGLQDSGEPGLEGVEVTLFNADNGQEVMEDAFGNPVVPQLTDNMGAYRFDDLLPGNYFLVFDAGGVTPDVYEFTQPNVDGNDNIDSDVDPVTGQTAFTGLLVPGEENLTLDAGFICAVEVEAGGTISVCKTGVVDLTSLGASLGGAPSGTWSTSGDGVFLNSSGDEISTAPFDFGVAVSYKPGEQDAANGSVTLTLSADAGTPCGVFSDEVIITVQNVDCGDFPWDGN
jgi:hypothetical protein